MANSTQKFVVNGKSANAAALNIDGSNYIKVAEFAELLNIDIHFNEKTNTVTFDKTKPYAGVRTGENDMGSTSYFRMEGEKKYIDFNIPELKGSETLLVGGMFMNKGETIQYEIIGERSSNFSIYCSNSQTVQSDENGIYTTGSKVEGNSLKISDEFLVETFNKQYYFYVINKSDKPIQNISGTITVYKK